MTNSWVDRCILLFLVSFFCFRASFLFCHSSVVGECMTFPSSSPMLPDSKDRSSTFVISTTSLYSPSFSPPLLFLLVFKVLTSSRAATLSSMLSRLVIGLGGTYVRWSPERTPYSPHVNTKASGVMVFTPTL